MALQISKSYISRLNALKRQIGRKTDLHSSSSNRHLQRLPVAGGQPQIIDTVFAVRCNNDHGISPDARWLAISDQSQGDHQSLVYIVPFAGGKPHRLTQYSPSYWHGWSPDGKTLAFVGQRSEDLTSTAFPPKAEKKNA